MRRNNSRLAASYLGTAPKLAVILHALLVSAALLITTGCVPVPPTPATIDIPPLPLDYLSQPSAGCGEQMSPGSHEFWFTQDGIQRYYELILPSNYDNTRPHPMLVNLHPVTMGDNGGILHDVWADIAGFNARVDQYGYIVVHPDGTGNPTAWNGGEECCAEPEFAVDDVAFIAALIDRVKAQTCIDERRVVAAGMSNGAYLAYRVACEAPQLFAAIAPVVGSFSSELSCLDGRAVPVFALSGGENSIQRRLESVAAFVEFNGCTSETEVSHQSGDVTCTTNTQCDEGASVTHCIVAGGGHCFFGDRDGYLASVGCSVRDDINSTNLIWQFLSQQWF